MSSFDALIWLLAVLDAGVAVVILCAAYKVTLRRVAVAAVLLGMLFAAELAGLAMFRVRGFGMLHLGYLVLVVSLPLIGLTLLWASRRRGDAPPLRALTRSVRLLAIGVCPLALVGLYATWIEPLRLQTETARVGVPSERAGAATIRVGVLADIQTPHVTEYERGAIERLMGLSPDLILLPGDLFQNDGKHSFDDEQPALHDLLGRLSAPGGVYIVLGDVDREEPIKRVIAGTGVKLLVNDIARTTVRDRTVTIGGTELDFRSAAAQAMIHQLEREPDQSDLRLLVSHRPDAALDLPAGSRIDLVVAGHTHGGQVVIPGFGPPMTLTGVPRAVAAGGLHELGGGRRIYVSRGVGLERGQAPRIRFLCPPEVSLLEIGS